MECLFCPRKFRDKFVLERHYGKHTKERPYFCSECPKELSSMKDLNYHLETHRPREKTEVDCHLSGTKSLCKSDLKGHEGTRSFDCEICKKKFANPQHVNQHKNSKSFICNVSQKAFNHKGNLNRHKKENHGMNQNKCHICGKTFSSKGNLSRHLKQHDPQRERFQCDKCPKIFLAKVSIKEHRSIHEDPDYSFKCDKCEQRFLTSRKLRVHKSNIHLDKVRTFSCPFCEKRLSNLSRLEFHVSRHTLERPYFCKLCPAEFIHPSSLYYHYKAAHCKNREKFKCGMCRKSYLTKRSLENHIRRHTGELHFKCESSGCGMQFVSNNLRKYHFLKVHEGKRFSCPTCGMKFLIKSNLRKHVLIHSGLRGYQCEVCDASFKQRGNLTRHKRAVHV